MSPDESVIVEVLRIQQDGSGGNVTTSEESLSIDVTTIELLPDVTATGQDLLEAIWHERRVELGMEQHRWFDFIRQDRAANVMQALGKDFQTGRHELFPIPQSEID